MRSTTERTDMRTMSRWGSVVLAAAAALLIAACGSSSSSSSSGGTGGAAKSGGTVTILEAAGGVDSLDPGYWYYQTDYADLYRTTQRSLYSFTSSGTLPTPDLATALPTASDGGKTLTIHIKPGIHYSAPLQNQTVVAADFKYALERCFLAQVGNGYIFTYFP
ncbi:MAG: hypothetical protein JO156_05660, partial [Solirubrobacterales bacterium]|nr:hypothetical protein [Solirubrobacterales bacterium]